MNNLLDDADWLDQVVAQNDSDGQCSLVNPSSWHLLFNLSSKESCQRFLLILLLVLIDKEYQC